MRGTQGALMIASTIQMILGFSGLWRNVIRLVWFVFLARSLIEKLSISQILFFRRLLSPLSAVPLISLVGFGLYELGFPGVSFLHRFPKLFLHWWGSYKMLHMIVGCKMCRNWSSRTTPAGCIFPGTRTVMIHLIPAAVCRDAM
jgi:hypothetical protein